MAKDPAFLLYSQDFLIGCAELTHEEVGQYFRILCYMHQKGRMKEETICFLVGLVSVSVKNKFQVDESGLWFNSRLEEETLKRNKYTESRRQNGLQGGRGHKKESEKDKAYGLHMPNHMEDENENENKEVVNTTLKESIKNIEGAKALHTLDSKKLKFYNELIPFVEKYGKDMIRDFYEYWTEPNKSMTKIKLDLERTWDLNRRLLKWSENESRFKKPNKDEPPVLDYSQFNF
jgi:uncharacterized protein YdaU (DUF1376 family)